MAAAAIAQQQQQSQQITGENPSDESGDAMQAAGMPGQATHIELKISFSVHIDSTLYFPCYRCSSRQYGYASYDGTWWKHASAKHDAAASRHDATSI